MNGTGRVLVAGCGDIGTVLALQLARAGCEVWGLRRRAQLLPAPLRTLSVDLTDPGTLVSLPERVNCAFYLATPDEFSDAAYRSTYVQGLKHLLAALATVAAPGARVVFVSSTSVYGQSGGEWVDEDSVTDPRRFSGQRLLEAEAVALGAPVRTTVVRFGGIYGPGRMRLVERVRAGAECTGDPPAYTNRIHRDDCAGILHHLYGLDDPAPIYLGVDDEPAAQCEVMEWLAARLGAPPPVRVKAKPGERPGRGASKRCSNARLRRSGYGFRFPSYREGYAAVLAASESGPAPC